jgi:hypothetical protein
MESKFPYGIGPILVHISTVGRNSSAPFVRVLCGTKNFERILLFKKFQPYYCWHDETLHYNKVKEQKTTNTKKNQE